MVMDDIERAVFELVEEYNARSIFTFKRYKLELDTDLNKDFKMLPEDAYELLEKFADRFNINPQEIEFNRYFPEDFGEAEVPLTIRLLVESAKAGKWLY